MNTPKHLIGIDVSSETFTSTVYDALAKTYGNAPFQVSATDANNQTTHTYYTDRSNNIWRPTRVVDRAGATTDIYYATAPTAVESILNFNGNNSTSGTRTTLDSSGRPHINQRRQAYGGQGTGNYDSVEADYDFAGRPSKVTVPYQAGAGGTSTGSGTTTVYDALDRPKEVDDAGGGWTKYTYDALGHLLCQHALPSAVSSVGAGDLMGDGKGQIFAGTVGELLYCLDDRGSELWHWDVQPKLL